MLLSMICLFLTFSSNLAIYFAILDFKPKAKIVMAKKLIWSVPFFLIFLLAALAFLINIATSAGLLWFLLQKLSL